MKKRNLLLSLGATVLATASLVGCGGKKANTDMKVAMITDYGDITDESFNQATYEGAKSCGEHPQAAASAGINVIRTRYAGVAISGALAGLGGLALIMTGSEWEFAAGANGFGFLALAVMIFGQWKPITIFLGSLLFGLFKTISILYASIPLLSGLNLPSYFYLALPYVVCLIVLIFTSKKSSAPKAEGIPYDKSTR